MNVLLLSMPDSFEHMPAVAIRMPNGALASLAGNVDPHHRVVDRRSDPGAVRASAGTVERLVRELAARRRRPVGDDVSAHDRVEDRAADPGAPSRDAHRRRRLRSEPRARGVRSSVRTWSFIVRGEGEQTLRELLRALEAARGSTRSPACRIGPRPASSTTPIGRSRGSPRSRCGCPTAAPACSSGYTLLGRPVDVVETSRGCTFDCSFCSIIEMRGRNFHTYPIERVLADIADARRHGARAIFLVDDNITLDVRRFESLCQAIIDSGFNDVDYIVQAMTSPLAAARRDAGAADAPRGIPLRLSRHRERARRRSGVPEGAARRTRAASTAARSATRPSTRSSTCIATVCSSSAA